MVSDCVFTNDTRSDAGMPSVHFGQRIPDEKIKDHGKDEHENYHNAVG